MAQTDARPGFRLPWSSDRQSADSSDEEPTTEQTSAASAWPSEDTRPGADASTAEAPAGNAPVAAAPATTPAESKTASNATPDVTPAASPAPQKPAKKPTKFMADLTKAMQAAAEEARGRAVTQLQADAKTYVESIHGRSSTEAANLRRAADDDVAAVREWSKAEIARIREETETKITQRKARLESEIEDHAAVIEREIDAVQKTVAAYEEEMAAFFERLLGEDDPSRFAMMAENLPEAPAFEEIVAGPESEETETEMTAAIAPTEVEPTEAVEAVVAADATPEDADVEALIADVEPATADDAATPEVEAVELTAATDAPDATESNDAVEASAPVAAADAEAGAENSTGSADGAEGELDREAAFAAIQAAAEAAASAEVAADAAARAEAVADVAIEIIGNHEDDAEEDPRFAALGLSPDFDAAEAEALAAAGSSDEEIPEIADETLAERLAVLVPGKSKGTASDAVATQVVVVGLVSVASIASFKRHLARVPGVQSVGVSSGPDGEFVFAVNHAGEVVLRDVIPALPSFQARVTGSSDGVVHVTAHDPESDA